MPDQIERYETMAKEQLGEECALWLEKGGEIVMPVRKLPYHARETVLC
jgi:hypothetical protein